MIVTRAHIQQFVPGDAKARNRWARMNAASSKFYYTRVRLMNAAIPAALENIMANTTLQNVPLVIDANSGELGRTGSFVPKAIIIAGASARKAALDRGEFHAMAWVGEKALAAMDVHASDGISSDELNQKLSTALSKKFVKDGTDAYGYYPNGPYIQYVYPFDNYFVFSMQGQDYKMTYSIDTTERTVTLTGTPEKVEREFIEIDKDKLAACGGTMPFEGRSTAPNIPLGVRVPSAMTLPSLFTVNLGANNSEQRNPMFGEAFLNVDKVVSVYKANIKNGYHSPIVPMNMPDLPARRVFAGELRARGVASPGDFFKWVDANKSEPLDMSCATDFAYGDKLPMHNRDAVRASMLRIDAAGIPPLKRAAVVRRLVTRAKGLGVDTMRFESENPTEAGGPGAIQAGGPGSGRRPAGGAKPGLLDRIKEHLHNLNQTILENDAEAEFPRDRSEASADVRAGGAGSGRYPAGSGGGKDKPVSQLLKDAGYEKDDSDTHEEWLSNHPTFKPANKPNGPDAMRDTDGDNMVDGGVKKGDPSPEHTPSTYNEAARGQTESKLKELGFNEDPHNTKYRPDTSHDLYYAKMENPNADGSGKYAWHSVVVHPNGSFDHSATLGKKGDGAADLERMKSVFASGRAVTHGEGYWAVQRVIDAATVVLSRQISAGASSNMANAQAKAMHSHLIAKGFKHTDTAKTQTGIPVRLYNHPKGHSAAVSAKGAFSAKMAGKSPVMGKTIAQIQTVVG